MVNEPTWPASDLKSITKRDTTVYTPPLRMIRAGGAGDITVTTQAGTLITFVGVSAGESIGPFFVSKVMAATTATALVGFE